MHKLPAALVALTMAIVIIGVDVAFFRRHIWERLAVNVTIVVIVAALYLLFARRA